MGSYQLIGNELHYTGDGWDTIKLKPQEIEQFKKGEKTGFALFNDGREVY